jgi:two-component system, sensor histidine kinase and response regulator
VTSILVIDDETALREVVVEMLQDEGFEADSAPDGALGLAMAGANPPDLVLCDLRMQGLSGYDVLASLRRDPRTALIPVIFLTGMAGADDVRQAMNVGADDYLIKPVSSQTLAKAVRARLDRSQAVRQEGARRLTDLRNDLARSLLPHELLTPLTVVMGLASLLQEEGAIEAGQVKEVAGGILLGAQELERMISKFLLYAEIQTSHAGLAVAPARAAEVLSEATRAKAARAGRGADVAIDLELFRSPMSVDHLQAVVQELVENALTFSKPGTAVAIRGRRDGSAYVLSVKDHGSGMTADQIAGMERAPFLRRNREQPGLGLGLTIVRKLAEIYGGQLTFDTAVGRGTTVHLRFAGASTTAAVAPSSANLWLDSADTITAVDDSWLEFARANDAPELTRQSVLGRPLHAFVSGVEMAELTGLLTGAARQRGTAVTVPFRCDSPGERRFMTMTLQVEAGGGVHIEYRLDRAEFRAEVPLLDVHAPRSEAFLVVCSWCRRVRQGDAWRDVERAIEEGDLFGRAERMPKVSHGICEDCASVVRASVRGELTGRPRTWRRDRGGPESAALPERI